MVKKVELRPVVLSADDDEDAHFLLKRAFVKKGARSELRQVNDGGEVIQYLEGEGMYGDRESYPFPDLVLLDLKMPKVSGFEVLEHVNNHPDLKQVPIVVFSTSDNEADIQRAYALGCARYVVKPTDFKQLEEFVVTIENELAAVGKKTDKARHYSPELTPFAVSNERPPPKVETRNAPLRQPQAESSEFFKLLVEQVKDYAIFMLDREGNIRSWNEGARRIKGYEPEEIIGRHFSTFYPRADIESEKPQFELKMAREIGRYEEEGWRLRKDGSRFWANVVITALHDKEGKLTGYAKVTRDLTQRKLQEEQFQRVLESEERFRLLVEQIKDYAIFILDAKGTISSWNQGARRIKGYSSDEIIGKNFSIFYTPEDLEAEKPMKEITTAIREGRFEEEGWRVRKDGSRFWASVVLTALWDKRGNLSGFAKVTRDLTQRRREEEALRQKTADLEAFAHTLSHDLRAPLRSIRSFSDVLRTEGAELSEKEKADYLNKISRSAQSMETLISDILKLSQVSLAPAPQERIPLEEVVDEAMEVLESQIKKSKGEIVVRKPLPTVIANRTLLVQIFTNLLSNALKFTRKGHPPKIEITGKPLDGLCELHVKDNGIGIPPEHRETIFQLFERGSADASFGGSGLGLSIVKKAVERNGGTIFVQSRMGEGSDFTIRLPCKMEAQIEAADRS